MSVQTSPSPSATHDDVDAGVIEDARARQHRHRRTGGLLLAAAVASAALIVGLTGRGGSGGHAGSGTGGFGGGGANVSLKKSLSGLPSTQRNGYGVADRACPLAPPNRYLPARAGCVEVTRTDLTGNGRTDAVIVYSVVSDRHPDWYVGPVPPEIKHDYVAEHAYLEVVFPAGASVRTRIRGPGGIWAAWLDLVSHVGDAPGKAIFLEVTRISSGGADVVYSLRDGHLVSAGPALEFGGDSAYGAGFACLVGRSPRVLQRTFELIGPTIYGSWRETELTYSWVGPKLVQTSRTTFREHGQPPRRDTQLASGCGPRLSQS